MGAAWAAHGSAWVCVGALRSGRPARRAPFTFTLVDPIGCEAALLRPARVARAPNVWPAFSPNVCLSGPSAQIGPSLAVWKGDTIRRLVHPARLAAAGAPSSSGARSMSSSVTRAVCVFVCSCVCVCGLVAVKARKC